MIMQESEQHVAKFVGFSNDNGDGPKQMWRCSCSFTGPTLEMDKHMSVPKTTTQAFQELHAAWVELRQAIIESLPSVIRKALKQWDTDRTK